MASLVFVLQSVTRFDAKVDVDEEMLIDKNNREVLEVFPSSRDNLGVKAC